MVKQINKIVIFGAGKIGRSFIGQLFSRSGYEVIFIDINSALIDQLNQERTYKVIIKSDDEYETLNICNVRGIDIRDVQRVNDELTDAGIAAVSLGQQALPSVIPLIASALVIRRERFGNWPLDLIIAENMRNSDEYLKEELCRHLPSDYPFGSLVGLVETSIGKMVPLMSQKDLEEDSLQVFAESYNTLIVSKRGFINPVPSVLNLEPKDNIKAWVDRKLFIHNLGHAAAAYLGYQRNPRLVYIYEALAIPEVFEATRQTMLQSADILIELYPDEFTNNQLEEHVDDLLRRFSNKALGDTIFRVGCDLYRKLSPDDRLVTPIRSAILKGKPFNLIYNVLLSAISFRATDENHRFFETDKPFFTEAELGHGHILRTVCRLDL